VILANPRLFLVNANAHDGLRFSNHAFPEKTLAMNQDDFARALSQFCCGEEILAMNYQ